MQISLRVVGALAIVAVFFIGTFYFLNYLQPRCPQGQALELRPPFSKFGSGFAYAATAPSLESSSDTSAAPKRSNYVVCEGRYVLGPAHTAHAEIDARGSGAFSHWNNIGFVFSASDNSDPNTNQRTYRAVLPAR
jgi:hypothetical protein